MTPYFFVPIHSRGELARTSHLGLMFSDLTLGRRGSPPQATPPPGWHDTGRTSSRCQPEPVGPSESIASPGLGNRGRTPWARSPCQRTSSEHLDRNLLAARQTWTTSQHVVSSASELRVYEGGVGAGVSYLHYYIYGSGPCTQHVPTEAIITPATALAFSELRSAVERLKSEFTRAI